MFKRTIILFCFIMSGICFLFFVLDNLSCRSGLNQAASCQHSYKLKISDLRGTIYDCRNIPLVNSDEKIVAAITPNIKSLNKVSNSVPEYKREIIYEQFLQGKPFTAELLKEVDDKDIDIFKIPIRYSGAPSAAHIIGYLSGDNEGVCGIEKAYNDYLSEGDSALYVRYNVDAANRILSGDKKSIANKSYVQTKGVVLNIDKRIQTISEEIANKYIKKGSVIVTQIPNCEIRASVSLPGFLPQSVSDYLNDKDSPLLNRAFCPYNIGSIFKLITSCSAIEAGFDENAVYDCRGGEKVEDWTFHCFNGTPHEKINMEQAVAFSCNSYFINVINHIGPERVYGMCEKFNLGKSFEFAPGMKSDKGNLPSLQSLHEAKIAANFSFGQGKLMVTPIQVSGIINALASGGIYSKPTLVKNLADENLRPVYRPPAVLSERVVSEVTASKIKNYMKASIDYGTSGKGKPSLVEAGAKTSTAETGIIIDGDKVIQSWYAGFFPFNNPKYCIVILSEDSSGGGESCGPVFREIADKMYKDFHELFVD